VAAREVVVNDRIVPGGLEPLDRVRPDIPSSTGDENVHVSILLNGSIEEVELVFNG
jgi:hypothetical protein